MIGALFHLMLAGTTSTPTCQQIHILPGGRVERRVVEDPSAASVTARGPRSNSAAAASASASASSSVSGSGGSRRSVSVTRDARGCRIVIDEGSAKD
jgi:hypothetical protein